VWRLVYFNDFSDTFSDVIDQEYLIGNSANIDELSNIVKNTYKDKSKNNIILYGHKGYGRKCALERSLLDYELKNNTNLLKVRIDAFVYLYTKISFTVLKAISWMQFNINWAN